MAPKRRMRNWSAATRGNRTVANKDSDLAAPPIDAAQDILDLSIELNLVLPTDSHINAYELRNQFLLERRLARVRYEIGVTLPARAEVLRADAERKARHSRILARNIKNATGEVKHTDADTHHIVAAADIRAARARARSSSNGASASTMPTMACIFRRSGRRRCQGWRAQQPMRTSIPMPTMGR